MIAAKQPSQNLRQFLSKEFQEIERKGENVISLKSNFPIFALITSPNEFAGPVVEAWAHIQLAAMLDNYVPAIARGQQFADASADYNGQPILLNIKAKDRLMTSRSRINLSSFQRYAAHYRVPNPTPFYILVCEYAWRLTETELLIIIERFKYTFNLLEIPLGHFKIEGAFEGSHRIFISPIPESAKTESTTYSIITPNEFLRRLEELRIAYNARKTTRARN